MIDRQSAFHDLVRAAAPLNYPMRCRTVVDYVIKRHAAPSEAAGAAGGTGGERLESELAAAVATPGTVAAVLRPLSAAGAGPTDVPPDLRAWTWRRLGSPGSGAWARGSESRLVWSLLMSPAPANDDELWWLASSNDLDATMLGDLLRPADPTSAPPRVEQGPPAGR